MAATNGSTKPLTFSLPSETGSMNGKYQLPTLAPLNFSLTDGTDIPPPPESPVEESKSVVIAMPKSAPPTPQQQSQRQDELSQPPTSPTSTSTSGDRPSSIRRFLSLKSLNSTYNHQPTFGSSDLSRPSSPSAKSSASTLGKKSWFMRVRKAEPASAEGKGAGTNGVAPEKAGPPAPKLPEVRTETGSLFGDEDVFGKIK
ncbi:MAG: hypothetical protein M1839_007642 [Geoglossum umbratile]|nr:MAG: hypothetical protein M1839_007642 [Geoglossum umbratile]